MKFELLMLRGLFAACTVVGALILGAMINATPPPSSLISGNVVSAALSSAPASCVLPRDGVLCPRSRS